VKFSSVSYFHFINLSGFINETACSSTRLLRLSRGITISTFRASACGRFFAAAAVYFLAVRREGKRNAMFSHFPHDLVQRLRYVSMDFVESVAVCAMLLRTRAKRRKRFWVHPLVGQRPLKGQLHKLCEDLRI